MFTATQAKNANYASAALSLVILLTRLIVSRRRQKSFDLSLWVVITSIVVDSTRLAIVYLLLSYGTASDALNDADYFDTHNLNTIKVGSILSLVARILIATTCWLQICLLLLFYTQIMPAVGWVARTIKVTWVTIGLTFVAVIMSTFLECRPFHLYWQISPNPGSCIKGYVQLLVVCVSNIVIDLMLLVISFPILTCKNRSWDQNLRVGILFLMGFFCIIVLILRLVSIYSNASAQPARSLWASVQMVVSTFVANAPTIYGDLKVTKRRKSESMLRRASRAEVWGNPDAENGYAGLATPSRVATVESERSNGSSRKEWFDHVEGIDVVR